MPDADILIIDDNESDSLLMREAIKNTIMANSLLMVPGAAEALKLLRKEGEYKDAPRPDLIIMDLNMPNMNGHQFLQVIKQDEKLRHIPVIILTASDNESDITQSYKLLANCYIVKPTDFVKFKRVVSVINDFWLGIARLPPKD